MNKKQRKQIRKKLLADKIKSCQLSRFKFELRESGFKKFALLEQSLNGIVEKPKLKFEQFDFRLDENHYKFLEDFRLKIKA